MVATILKSKNALSATFTIVETFAKIKELSRNINAIMKTTDKDGEVIETTTKCEFNLGFAKVSRSVKKIKEKYMCL